MALAPIQLSNFGLTGWVDPSKINTGDLHKAENVDFSYGHMLQKEGGTLKVNATPLTGSPSVMAGVDFLPTAPTQRPVIPTRDGELFKDGIRGNLATLLKAGLGRDPSTPNLE